MRSLEEALAAEPWKSELGDAIEQLAFNALPAAVSDDHWTHQYITQTNAAFAGIEKLEPPPEGQAAMSKIFGNVGADATAYGLSPNFPCCTVNYAQGWPKLVSLGLWLWENGGMDFGLRETPALLSAAFAPSIISVPAPVGGTIELETTYPFTPDGPLRYKINNIRPPLKLLVRIPGWADLSSSEVTDPSGRRMPASSLLASALPGQPDAQTESPSLLSIEINVPSSTWEVRFALDWELRAGKSWGATLHFGPLTYARPILHDHFRIPMDDGPYGPGPNPPPNVRDEFLVAKGEAANSWAIALILNASSQEGLRSSLLLRHPTHPLPKDLELSFSTDDSACPLFLSVAALPWPSWEQLLPKGAAGEEVYGPLKLPEPPTASKDMPEISSGLRQIELKPFGCTRLRMTQLPVFGV
eukprot:TRINITY_DN53749_c0_g1_i1.p1 TRINITY_DN53749_c0_g1~~TRINITY_DN53749_c0_g1_i1.p1  ORF type:complete len:414 (-),score=83.66 TRINITY_DN53749_c0_g1_i1:274-1515(-)